jgi:hypothetical protein
VNPLGPKGGNSKRTLTRHRVLYVSPCQTSPNNGMLQRQLQVLSWLDREHKGRLDVLSLGASSKDMDLWLERSKLECRSLRGLWASLAFWNSWAWYVGFVVLRNKLKLGRYFNFPVVTPLPDSYAERYSLIVCYYPWAYALLTLDRFGDRVVVDAGDVMANRHERIGTRRWISISPVDEQRMFKTARCVSISSTDRTEFGSLYGVETPVVPFVPPGVQELSLTASSKSAAVGFIAAPGYANEQIVSSLVTDGVIRSLASEGIEFLLAGGICGTLGDTLLHAVRAQGGVVLGRIDSLREFYSRVSVLMNPVGPSTGMKIKSVEALVSGRGLVTTRWGVDEHLTRFFGPQLTFVEWPLEGKAVTAACVKACAAGVSANRDGAEQYLQFVEAAFSHAFSLGTQ